MDEGLMFLFGMLTGIVLAFIAIFRMIAGMHETMERRVR